ncbi:DUF3939 domain-containing protein [Paenibacillus cremeus]|uniref:DUF3939 domain-containing protein n=1 Tax=Paenibacillus cremeus TaxID=2163881 RepID=A0A559KHJ6_9BACL|nr:DUF3939 domain-containing protein [Paenibacillus cremeus]TVY11604.1 DUF3939 domain-containing protein [Paenibacillus cremeus]
MKSLIRLAAVALIFTLLSGCLYPKEMRKENQIASGEYVVLVQNAIDQYKAKTGVLPIKNSEETTPIYEKYPIDFKKLKGPYLSTVPANAFENGGTATYVLVDAETKPTVKMMDIPSFQQTVDLQKAVDDYKAKTGQLPKGQAIAQGFSTIDYAKLSRKPDEVQSMYSREIKLPFMLHDSGVVAIDYAPEIMRLIDKKQLQSKLDPKQDLRQLLVQESFYVPARSFPYFWHNGQPVPFTAP